MRDQAKFDRSDKSDENLRRERVKQGSRSSLGRLALAAVAVLQLFAAEPVKAQTPPLASEQGNIHRVLTPEEQAKNDRALEEDRKALKAVKETIDQFRKMGDDMRLEREKSQKQSEDAMQAIEENLKNMKPEKSPLESGVDIQKRGITMFKEINDLLTSALKGKLTDADRERIRALNEERKKIEEDGKALGQDLETWKNLGKQ